MNNCNNWFYLCLALLGLILILVAMFMGYNLKLDRRTVKLEKKNGHEQKQLDNIEARVSQLEKSPVNTGKTYGALQSKASINKKKPKTHERPK